MSSINEDLKSLFIHIPKCAGTSMSNVSWNKGNGHSTIENYRNKINLNEYFKWCFVRNPFSRIVSAYVTCPEIKHLNFEDVVDLIYENRPKNFHVGTTWESIEDLGLGVRRIHFYPMFSLVGGEMDFVGRFESLEADWEKVCSSLKILEALPQKNIRKVNYLDYYTSRLEKMVAEIYEKDFEFFNYPPSL